MELNKLKMGVLDDTQLLTYDYREQKENVHYVYSTQVWTLGQLLDGAHHFNIDTMWITPGSHVSKIAQRLLRALIGPKEDNEFVSYVSKKTDGTPRYVLVYRKNGNTKSVKIGFPEHDTRWPWQHADAEALFRSILCLQDALQFEVAWSPGHTGQELILHLDKHHWLEPINFPDVLKRNLAVDWRWKRPLREDEKKIPMYLHLFDGNSKYLAACTGISVGEGDPEYFESHGGDITFQARTPGAWWIPEWGWLWTPELEYEFAKLDDEKIPRPLILQAYIWPRYHEAMKAWGRHMWNARCKLSPTNLETLNTYPNQMAKALAYDAMKPCYVEGMGWLAHPSQTGDNKLYRPDIWSMIVAGCKRSMGFKVRQLAKQGLDVCYIDVDTIGIVSDSTSVEPFRRWLLDRETQLGGFKYQGCILLSPDLMETFEPHYKQDACHKAIKAALQERGKEA